MLLRSIIELYSGLYVQNLIQAPVFFADAFLGFSIFLRASLRPGFRPCFLCGFFEPTKKDMQNCARLTIICFPYGIVNKKPAYFLLFD